MSGPVPVGARLRVRDGPAELAFYRDVLGLSVRSEGREMRIAPPGGSDPFLVLEVDPSAPSPAGDAAGLFHLALRVARREDLARLWRRLGAAGVAVRGAADHGVSEALYLADADGHGLEVYVDRPASGWTWQDGEIRMTTEPLDLRGLLATSDGEAGLPPDATLGHLHLRTTDLPAAGAFWTDEVGLDVTTRAWPGALFLASGGYHHHLGLNTWGGPLRRRSPGAAGLLETTWRAPGRTERADLEDPDGHRVVLLPG